VQGEKMKKIIAILFVTFLVLSCKQEKINSNTVFVSILPQKYFVERITGDLLDVQVMVRPGFNPRSYEPTPKQFALLDDADLFFAIGVPFEQSWLPKIESNYPDLKISNTQDGVTFRMMKEHHHHDDEQHVHTEVHDHDHNHADEHEHKDVHKHEEGIPDPHIWLDPILVIKQIENIKDALIAVYPENRETFEKNFMKFSIELKELDKSLHTKLDSYAGSKFMVFHPSWGYLAERYHLMQIPIEIEGKEPTTAQLGEILSHAKKENIKVIFIQKQFSQHSAKSIAEEIDGEVVQIDPLSYDYIENLEVITDKMISAFKRK
jgi:zinc transport system substrate-binding protein